VENSRNMILAVLLSALVLFGGGLLSEQFFPQPKAPPAKTASAEPTTGAATTAPAAATKPVSMDRNAAIAASPRVTFANAAVKGSINLTGAVMDDLVLLRHRQKREKDSPAIHLLSPAGTKESYFASFGWTAAPGVAVPNAQTVWRTDKLTLAPGAPVTLSWDNGAGLLFSQKIALDNDYLFTVDQSVTNSGTAAVGDVAVAALINRTKGGVKEGSLIVPGHDQDTWTMHVGPIGAFNGAVNYDVNYEDLTEAGPRGSEAATKGGWLGFGETYWLTALVPSDKASVATSFKAVGNDFQADFAGPKQSLAPGATLTTNSRFFAGAKEINLLNAYEKAGLPLIGNAIDWGWFGVIEKPIFWLLEKLFKLFGNFGFAIIALTFLVRGLMFPIAQRQFESMARMRGVQPKLKAIQERHKDDKQRLQTEMMELYKKEKINPFGGCLPIFLQIPVFYGLYKVLNLAIEMRHQPFALWIHDLSAPDPATVLNLFGMLPFTPTGFFAIGVLPIFLGITMYLQFKLNPAPMDPAQQQIFAIMPWVMMIMMAPFAAGLQLYWTVSNLLTIAQQKWLYSKHPALKEPVVKEPASKEPAKK
jgi:YidC/Oxa1 family membrane protein insertase